MERKQRMFGARSLRRLALSLAAVLVIVLGLCPAAGTAEEVVVEPEEVEETTVVVQGEGNQTLSSQSEDDTQVVTQDLAPISYLDWDDQSKQLVEKTGENACKVYNVVQSSNEWTQWGVTSEETWYVVNEDVTINASVKCWGTVHLILCDGKTLTVNGDDKNNGINVGTGGLTIYAQSEGEQRGKLIVGATFKYGVAINSESGGITINGGIVRAAGEWNGIYGGGNGTGFVTINGGQVDASANQTNISTYERRGIFSNGGVTINGGEVTASAISIGNTNAYGIYGNPTHNGTVTINGGKVTASANCTGTGSAYGISGKTVTVNNGLTVMAGDAAPGTDVTSTFATDHTQKWVHIQKVIPVDSVSLNKTSATVTVGDTETLTVTVNPEDATNKAVTWKSSNESVATVDENGMVTAVGAGTATITATSNADNTKSASCTVTVKAKDEPKPEPTPTPAPTPGPARATKPSTIAHVAAGTIDASWKAVKGAKAYQVQWRVAGGKWKTRKVKKTSYTIPNLKSGKTYDIRVRAVKGADKGAWSKATRRWLKTASKVKAASGKAKGSVKVSWKKDKKATGGYKVFVYAKRGGELVATKVVSKAKASATIKGLKSGRTYYVRVRPYRTRGGATYVGTLSGYRSAKAK